MPELDLSTEAKRLVHDLEEAMDTICELRDRADGELRQRLILSLVALYDARTEAKTIADA